MTQNGVNHVEIALSYRMYIISWDAFYGMRRKKLHPLIIKDFKIHTCAVIGKDTDEKIPIKNLESECIEKAGNYETLDSPLLKCWRSSQKMVDLR